MAVQRSRTARPERATDRVLMPFAKDDAEGQARVTAFLRELQRKADIELARMNVRFRGNSGHRDFRASFLLLTHSDIAISARPGHKKGRPSRRPSP
jgi:hypothetical protein